MAAHEVAQPVPFVESFAREDEPAVLSRAASLLLLGAQLESEPMALAFRSALEGTEADSDLAPPEDVEPLQVPVLEQTGDRLSRARALAVLAEEMAISPDEVGEPRPEARAELAARLNERPTLPMAAALFEASLHDPHEVVRVAAAIGYLDAAADPLAVVHPLVEGTRSEDPLVRDLAATGLARFAPDHPALAELRAPSEPGAEGEPSHTSLLVHGTWARGGSWWQPGGDFHTYVSNEVPPDRYSAPLYSQPDRFDWTGGYSDAARALGAQDLVRWVGDRALGGLDLFCHSHGGSVAMLASQQGLEIGKLVLLSCPVHRHKYFPNFARVREVVSIRVRLDLVILADGGGQRFRDVRIREEVLPLWFDHSAARDPEVWRKHHVPDRL
jgi:hypothetical protein